MFSFFQSSADQALETNCYNFSFSSSRGDDKITLRQFEGKVILIVNTASRCGFTPQYQKLENLYEKYQEKGLVIIGVPSNDFGKQEPGTNEEIANFCELTYKVTFPIVSKEVVRGNSAHPFYVWAKKTLGFGTAPKWNFHKYLINRKGELIDYFNSTTAPDAERVKLAIEKALEN